MNKVLKLKGGLSLMGWKKDRETEAVKAKSYWLVHDKGLEIWECTLSLDTRTIKTVPKKGESAVTSQFNDNNLFGSKADAITRQRYLKNLYTSFQRTPYVTLGKIEKNLTELLTIESEIREQLKDYPNFDGIDFCDVFAGGIQIRGHHKAIEGYTYGSQITIKYDFTNWEECIEQFVNGWKRSDIDKNVESFQSFLDAGNRWGWD